MWVNARARKRIRAATLEHYACMHYVTPNMNRGARNMRNVHGNHGGYLMPMRFPGMLMLP